MDALILMVIIGAFMAFLGLAGLVVNGLAKLMQTLLAILLLSGVALAAPTRVIDVKLALLNDLRMVDDATALSIYNEAIRHITAEFGDRFEFNLVEITHIDRQPGHIDDVIWQVYTHVAYAKYYESFELEPDVLRIVFIPPYLKDGLQLYGGVATRACSYLYKSGPFFQHRFSRPLAIVNVGYQSSHEPPRERLTASAIATKHEIGHLIGMEHFDELPNIMHSFAGAYVDTHQLDFERKSHNQVVQCVRKNIVALHRYIRRLKRKPKKDRALIKRVRRYLEVQSYN